MERPIGYVANTGRPYVHESWILHVSEEGYVFVEPGITLRGSGNEALASWRVAHELLVDRV